MTFENTHENQRNTIPNEDRQRIVDKSLEGESTAKISKDLKIKYQTVNSVLKKYYKTGIIIPKTRGGRANKLSCEQACDLLRFVEENPMATLEQMQNFIYGKFSISLSLSGINKYLKYFTFTLKKAVLVPEPRNDEKAIERRYNYALKYRDYETENDPENFIFIDEVGFSVVSRTKKARSLRGTSAYVDVSSARSRNISVVAAMNKQGMIFKKVYERPVNGVDFKNSFFEIHQNCIEIGITNPIFIMDNARIHHYSEFKNDPLFQSLNVFYLPAYSPFLNPIENVFSVWKNLVKRSEAKNENELRQYIDSKFQEITLDHCNAFYRKMLSYLVKSQNREIILE